MTIAHSLNAKLNLHNKNNEFALSISETAYSKSKTDDVPFLVLLRFYACSFLCFHMSSITI